MRGPGLLLAALWAAATAAPVFADGSRLDAILESHALRVGTTGDYRPFCTWRGKTANSTPFTPSGFVERAALLNDVGRRDTPPEAVSSRQSA